MRAVSQATLLLFCVILIGCTKEIRSEAAGPGIDPSGKASVRFSVNTPQPTLPSAMPRSQTSNETSISEIRVFVFEKAGDEYVFSYHVNGTGAVASGSTTQFKALLAGADVPVKLIILANSQEAFLGEMPEAGDSEPQVKKMLNNSYSSNGLQENLPMFGEVILEEGIDASQSYILPVTVLRAVARVDVVKDLNAGSGEFILAETYVYRANDKIQLIPEELTGGDMPKVNAPSVPEGTAHLVDPIAKYVENDPGTITQIYIPESFQAVSNAEKIGTATTVIVGGRYGGEGNPVTYYRADFNSGIEGHPFGQVLRNHRYIFKIKNVSAEGWPTPDEAASHLSSSIIIDVQPWEDFSSEMYLGNDRFGVSSREVNMRYTRNREKVLDVESTLTYQIQWVENGAGTGNAVSDYDTPIENGNFSARIVRQADDSEYVTHLVLTTLKDNHLGDAISNTLRITAGRWTVDITVKQDNSAMYSNKVVSVLSVETVGNLGVNMVDPGASGLAMRKVLDTQFSSTGTIRTGGYSFTRIPNNTNYLGTTNSSNMAVLSRIFGAQDVIYLPYDVIISADVAAMIEKWLKASSHRVLILGTDSDASSKNLRLLDYFQNDGTWEFTNVASTAGTSYSRAPESAETMEFFDGPFGNVSASAAFGRADATAGYTKAPGNSVTPLIISSVSGNEGYMFFGVNKTNRVVYDGDAQLFQSGQMSNNTGNVTSDLDKLMANLWAWITEQVIYGNN